MNTIDLRDHAKASQIMWLSVLRAAADQHDDGALKLAWKGYCKATDRLDFLTGGDRPCSETDPETWVMIINDFQNRFRRVPVEAGWTRKACIQYLRCFDRPLAGYTEVGSFQFVA